MRHALLIQEVTPEAVAEALQAGAECVCPRANALTPEGVGMLRAEKLEVRAWGVRTVEVSRMGRPPRARVAPKLGVPTRAAGRACGMVFFPLCFLNSWPVLM